jgi:AAA ATPase domain
MQLKRVRVPNFRVLKDVDITFEPDLVPRIFPLGSLNGGGKSTLLQLIFTLLHCCTDDDRIPYLQNMLDGFEIDLDIGKRDLATIEIVIDGCILILDFYCYSLDKIKIDLSPRIEISEDVLTSLLEEDPQIKFFKSNCYSICKIIESLNEHPCFLVCEVSGLENPSFLECIKNINKHVFLAAPITQVFRFIDRADRSLLFKGGSKSHKYYSQLDIAKSRLPGFFAYDLLAVNLLIQAFITARDDDFRVAISNGGKYGNSYQALIEDLNRMLVDKSVNIDLDFEGVSFTKVDGDGKTIQLYPEDLSHGELKRLSLYMWLKFNKIENAIVLMDEVEIALHPDWQYQIVNDLQTWAPNNQYILATHSYELCQALTPAHVKEIEPKLIKK